MARRKSLQQLKIKEGEQDMTIDEAKEALEELKKEGNSVEDILKILYVMYQDNAITLSDLRSFTELLGYEFTEEFEAMSDEDKKTKGFEKTGDKPAEGVDKEDVEKAKEFGDDADEKDDKKGEDEDDDAKAARLFGFGSDKK